MRPLIVRKKEMKMKAYSILVIMVLTFSIGVAEARLGETAEQCEERYGKHTWESSPDPGMVRRGYEKNGVRISIDFAADKDGKPIGEALAATFSDLAWPENLEQPLAQSPCRDLLNANAQGLKWNVNGRLGTRSDNTSARWYLGYNPNFSKFVSLELIAPKYFEMQTKGREESEAQKRKAEKEEKQQKVKGF